MLSESVAGAARHFGDRPAVVTDGVGLTWGQLHEASERLAPMLSVRGIGPGSVVCLGLRSGAAWLVAATAVDRAGAAIAGISPVATPSERAAMVSAVDPALVLAEEDLVEGLPLRTDVAVLSEDGLALDGSAGGAAHATVPAHDRSPDRLFAVCFTSGTTGSPKAAAFSVANAIAVQRIDVGDEAARGFGGGSAMLASTQFAHVGFVLKAPWYARLGCTLHVMPRWSARSAIELLAEHRMATLGVVAPQLALILASPGLEDADLSALRLVIAGGAPSPPALIEGARERLGVDYSVRWSSTESGGVGLAALIDDDHLDAVGSIGHPRAGVSARIAGDGAGDPVADGQVGELQIRSGAMMECYLGSPEATAEAMTSDGWLRTGDLARRRADGRFVLAGRESDMYIRGGYNVHPEEVEAVLGSHPDLAAVAVAARPDEVMGEIGVAVVVIRPGHDAPTLDELREFAADRIARHKLPEDLMVAEEVPLTAAAKLDRRRLQKLVAPCNP